MKRTFLYVCVAAALTAAFFGLGREAKRELPVTFRSEAHKPVCLVLSVGAQDGLAHLGAIRAITRHSDLDIRCVTGASMGSLVAGLYATAPLEDPVQRYEKLMGAYISATKAEKGSSALLFGALFGMATGGLGWAAAGAALGSMGPDEVSHSRLIDTMDRFYQRINIQQLPIHYAAFHLVS